MTTDTPICELCSQPGGELLWQDAECRIVRVADADYPGFCRVIWKAHVREMSDLDPASQLHLLRVVMAVETTVRRLFVPDKINLASFGNMVPHLHWHIIPRWRDDRHFPEPIWGRLQRDTAAARPLIDSATLTAALLESLVAAEVTR